MFNVAFVAFLLGQYFLGKGRYPIFQQPPWKRKKNVRIGSKREMNYEDHRPREHARPTPGDFEQDLLFLDKDRYNSYHSKYTRQDSPSAHTAAGMTCE